MVQCQDQSIVCLKYYFLTHILVLRRTYQQIYLIFAALDMPRCAAGDLNCLPGVINQYLRNSSQGLLCEWRFLSFPSTLTSNIFYVQVMQAWILYQSTHFSFRPWILSRAVTVLLISSCTAMMLTSLDSPIWWSTELCKAICNFYWITNNVILSQRLWKEPKLVKIRALRTSTTSANYRRLQDNWKRFNHTNSR